MENKIHVHSKREKILLYTVFLAVTAFNVFLAINHVCWRDETQAWLIARDCSISFKSLFTVTSYEGHPALWFLLLMPFAKIGLPFLFLKVVSVFFATFALRIFLFKSKFPVVLKTVIGICPVFVAFFAVPARSYSLCAFLVMALMSIYHERDNKPIIYGLVLALLLQTLTIMAGFVFFCCVTWLVEAIYKTKEGQGRSYLLRQGTGLCIPFVSALFLLYEFRYTASVLKDEPKETIGITEKLLNYMKVTYYGLRGLWGYTFVVVLAIVLILVIQAITRDKKYMAPIIVFLGGIIWQIWIYADVFKNSGNHRTLTWVLMLIWLLNAIVDWGKLENRRLLLIAGCFLLLWLYSSKYEISYDLGVGERVYSDAKNTADALNRLPNDAVIVATAKEEQMPIVPYLDDEHRIWNPISESFQTYVDRSPSDITSISYEEYFFAIKKKYPGAKDCYVIENIVGGSYWSGAVGLCTEITDGEIYYETSMKSIRESYRIVKVDL